MSEPMSRLSKEERERITRVEREYRLLSMDSPNGGSHTANEVMLAQAVPDLLGDIAAADEHIEFLSRELKAKGNKLNQKGGELKAKRERIAELERQLKNRDNRLRKKMAKIAALTSSGKQRRQNDQLREQGQYIETLKARIAELTAEVERLKEESHNLHDQITDYEEELIEQGGEET